MAVVLTDFAEPVTNQHGKVIGYIVYAWISETRYGRVFVPRKGKGAPPKR